MARWVDPPMVLWNARAASSGVYTFDYDFSAYEQVTFWYSVTATAGDPSSATLNAVWARKEPSILLSDSQAIWLDITGSSIAQIATDSNDSNLPATAFTQLTSSHLSGRVRLTLTVDASGGTTPSLTTTVTALLKG